MNASPGDDEMAAIAAAIALLAPSQEPPQTAQSAWIRAARLEAVGGESAA